MKISEERINELMEAMLSNADEDGWCKIPDGLSDEENDEITKRLTILTMQERIENLSAHISEAISFMDDLKENIDEFDTLEKIKIKGVLDVLKEDSQTTLIDLHTDDLVRDFFKIDLILGEEEEAEKNAEKAKLLMGELIVTVFKESISDIKNSCMIIIEKSDECSTLLDLNNE